MVQYLTQHAHTLLIDLFRVCVWLAILSVIFVPLERLFALHREKIFRPEIGDPASSVRPTNPAGTPLPPTVWSGSALAALAAGAAAAGAAACAALSDAEPLAGADPVQAVASAGPRSALSSARRSVIIRGSARDTARTGVPPQPGIDFSLPGWGGAALLLGVDEQ